MLSWNLTEIRLQGEMIRVVLLVAERWENIKFDILFPLWFMATKTAKDIKEASKQKNLICLMFDLRNFFSVTSRFNCQWHIAEVLFFTLIELFIFNKSIAFALALWMLLKCHKNRLDVVDFFVLRNKPGLTTKKTLYSECHQNCILIIPWEIIMLKCYFIAMSLAINRNMETMLQKAKIRKERYIKKRQEKDKLNINLRSVLSLVRATSTEMLSPNVFCDLTCIAFPSSWLLYQALWATRWCYGVFQYN